MEKYLKQELFHYSHGVNLMLLSIREAPTAGELKRDICTKERLVTLRSIIVAAEAIVAVCLSDTVVYIMKGWCGEAR